MQCDVMIDSLRLMRHESAGLRSTDFSWLTACITEAGTLPLFYLFEERQTASLTDEYGGRGGRERERELPGHLGPDELEMMKSNSFLKPRFVSEANM